MNGGCVYEDCDADVPPKGLVRHMMEVHGFVQVHPLRDDGHPASTSTYRDRWWALVDWATGLLSRVPCRFGFHSLSCRGRVDHDPSLGHWTTQW